MTRTNGIASVGVVLTACGGSDSVAIDNDASANTLDKAGLKAQIMNLPHRTRTF